MTKKQFASSVNRQNTLKKMLLNLTSAILVICLVSVSTPAATETIIGAAGKLSQEARYRYLSTNLAFKLPDWLSNTFKSKKLSSRKQDLSRIKIYPGDIVIKQGEQIVFAAVGFDAQGEPVNGVDFEWTAVGAGNASGQFSFTEGKFEPWVAGDYTVTVTGNGLQARSNITVNSREAETSEISSTQKNPISVSTRSIPGKSKENYVQKGSKEVESSPAESENLRSVDDPDNLPGNPPGAPADGGATSGNFQLSVPVISLPGRGIDLALNLNYNSRVWNKTGSTLTYDFDGGFPAPGWSLGFGKIKDMGANNGSLLIDADGTRHPYAGALTDGGATFSGYTTDGKFIDYKSLRDSNGIYSAKSWLPNGTYIEYGAKGGGAVYPTKIRDIQGNYINITYRNNQGPAIETITDTLGRVITFNYDSSTPARLLSITAPRMQNEDPIYGTGATRTILRLHYDQKTLNYSFASGVTPIVGNSAPHLIDAIYFPGTDTGYWFGDADSYSSYGMLTKVQETRAMSWSAGSTEQGDITAGQMTKQALYNYPLTTTNESGRTNGVGLTDAPNYTTLSESWAERDVNEDAVTTYGFNNNTYKWDGTSNSPARMVSITQPNGLISRQYSYRTPNTWTDGLVFADETIVMNGKNEVVVSSSLVSWQQGDYQSPRPGWTQITDEKGKKVRTEYDYGSGIFNQILRTCDYDDANVKLRCTNNVYENSQAYKGTWVSLNTGTEILWIFSGGRHLFNLVTMTNIENPDGTIASQTNYEYDNYQSTPLMNTAGVIKHEASHDPYTTQTITYQGPCINWYQPPYGSPVCTQYQIITSTAFDAATNKRGNVTKVTNYSDANNPSGPAGAIYETKGYDITGNLRTTSSSCCEQSSFEYTSATHYAYPISQTRGSADPNSPHRITASSVYDFDSGLVKQETDVNGRTSNLMYNPNTMRPVKSISSTGAYSVLSYDDAAMTKTEEVYTSNNNLAGKTVTYLNGLGLTRREESRVAANVWDIVETKYNKYGEKWKESRPFRTGDTIYWGEMVYDPQGRLSKVIAPNGSETKAFYEETNRPSSATSLPGSTMRVVDAWGRERWGRYDQQGRLAEIIEPNPDRTANPTGSVFSAGNLQTKYSYDTLGNLIKTEQGAQIREFKYDSLNRLIRQKLAEQTATLNDAGSFVGAGSSGAKWSEAFTYDSRSNLIQKTDARGVRTNFSYQIGGADDPLNRLQSRTYDVSGPLEPNFWIHNAPTVTYSYITTGDKSRVSQIRTAGLLTEDFTYDTEGRIRDYTQTVDLRGSSPMTASFFYDSLDRIDETWYPAQYGLPGSPRKIVKHLYDEASRLSTLKLNGAQIAGNIVYNADDQTTSIKIGTGTYQETESYTFDPETGLLTNQKVEKATITLLDLSYDYNRNNAVGSLSGKTGHLTKIINNLDSAKNREYEYDSVGRLTKAKGGANGNLWQQEYSYDRYGNRLNVTASGTAADNSPIPLDGLPNLSYDNTSNRITNTGFEYDAAGNQIRAKAEDGSWLKFEYDAANRLQIIKRDSDGAYLQAFQYGSTNARLMDMDYQYGYLKIFASVSGTTLAEYTEFASTAMTWTKSSIYLGDGLLSTITPNGSGGEITEYAHPDQLGTRLITQQWLGGSTVEQAHLPFGTALNGESSVTNNPRRFTSYERSARTGLDYAINRTYDSKQGRFTQIDPLGIGASSLGSPQTLNLYTYCGNDPVNHVDPDGLFFGKLFKWIFKIVKIIAAVILAAVAVLAFSMGDVWSGIQFAMQSAQLFADVSGNKMFQKLVAIASIAVSTLRLHFRPNSTVPIFPFGGDGGEGGGGIDSRWLSIFGGVGAIANSFAQRKDKKRKRQSRVQELTDLAVKGALARLSGKCLTAVGFTGQDPKGVLRKIWQKGQVKYDPDYVGKGNIARGDLGMGAKGTIHLGDEFYKDRVGGKKNSFLLGDLGKRLNTSQKARELVILHELRHVITGRAHPFESSYDFDSNIIKNCGF